MCPTATLQATCRLTETGTVSPAETLLHLRWEKVPGRELAVGGALLMDVLKERFQGRPGVTMALLCSTSASGTYRTSEFWRMSTVRQEPMFVDRRLWNISLYMPRFSPGKRN
jgi:hypothetical protein